MSDFLQKIKEQASKQLKHIVLPEGHDERIVLAAQEIAREGFAKLTVFGNPNT
ncbi:MAG: phosphate acyltransferase, partial [Coriobacteriia bacterium]|nr:phosphate acyltransferase [Coriobacteriia bacterium]